MPRPVPYPFPGMDPWMQIRWGNTHTSLTTRSVDALNAILPGDLYATAEERIVRQRDGREGARPDLIVFAPSENTGGFGGDGFGDADDGDDGDDGGGVAVARPAVARKLRVRYERVTEPYLNVVRADGGELVTTIEWVSPTNKLDPSSRRDCRRKRAEVIDAGANALDIDLTRGGPRHQLFQPAVPSEDTAYDEGYAALAWRGDEPDVVDLYQFDLRQRLPVLPVPLRPGDPLVTLDLQALVEGTWRSGRYWNTDYAAPCRPPLGADDAAWAAARVAAWREAAGAAQGP